MNAHWLADRIELWPIDKLLPYVRNARQHSDEQIAQIGRASCRERVLPTV